MQKIERNKQQEKKNVPTSIYYNSALPVTEKFGSLHKNAQIQSTIWNYPTKKKNSWILSPQQAMKVLIKSAKLLLYISKQHIQGDLLKDDTSAVTRTE